MDQTPVHLQLLLSRSPGADPSSQTGQGISEPHQAHGPVPELGQLHLDLSLPGPGPGCENIQDHHGAVHDLRIQGVLQVFKLGRGKLVVTDDCEKHPVQVQAVLPEHPPRPSQPGAGELFENVVYIISAG